MLKGGERKGQAVRQMRTSQTRANVDTAVTESGTPGKQSPVQCLEALRGRLHRSSRAWNLTPGSGACCIPVPWFLLASSYLTRCLSFRSLSAPCSSLLL